MTVSTLSIWIFVTFDKKLIPIFVLAIISPLELGTALYEISLKFDANLRYLTVKGMLKYFLYF